MRRADLGADHVLTPVTPRAASSPRVAASGAARSPGAITRRPQARHGLDLTGRILYIETAAIPLDRIAHYDAVGLSEKDLSTSFATIGIFSAVAGMSLFAVLETGWRTKFLIEGVLFGAIALCAIAELFSARRLTLYTFKLTLEDGTKTTFVTADNDQAKVLKAALDS
jgi:hypothetical protein